MKKIVLILALLMPSPAWAMFTPMFGGSSTNLNTTSVRYEGFNSSPSNTESEHYGVASMPGNIEGLRVDLSVAPDTGAGVQSYVFVLMKNSSPTSLTCTVSDTNTSCTSSAVVPIAPGDTFSVRITPSGTPTAAAAIFTSVFNSFSGGASFLYASPNAGSPATGSTSNAAIMGTAGWNQFGVSSYIPTAGTELNLYVQMSGSAGAAASGKQYVFTVLKNSVATGLTCTIFETATSCSDTNPAHAVSIIGGDKLVLQANPSNTPTSRTVTFGSSFMPSIDGESMYMLTQMGTPSASNPNYVRIQGYNSGTSTTEAFGVKWYIPSINNGTNNISARKIYATGNAPGNTSSFVNSIILNGSASIVSCTRSGTAATTCNNTSLSAPLTAGDTISFLLSPTGSPTVGAANAVSCVLFVDPNDKLNGSTLYGEIVY